MTDQQNPKHEKHSSNPSFLSSFGLKTIIGVPQYQVAFVIPSKKISEKIFTNPEIISIIIEFLSEKDIIHLLQTSKYLKKLPEENPRLQIHLLRFQIRSTKANLGSLGQRQSTKHQHSHSSESQLRQKTILDSAAFNTLELTKSSAKIVSNSAQNHKYPIITEQLNNKQQKQNVLPNQLAGTKNTAVDMTALWEKINTLSKYQPPLVLQPPLNHDQSILQSSNTVASSQEEQNLTEMFVRLMMCNKPEDSTKSKKKIIEQKQRNKISNEFPLSLSTELIDNLQQLPLILPALPEKQQPQHQQKNPQFREIPKLIFANPQSDPEGYLKAQLMWIEMKYDIKDKAASVMDKFLDITLETHEVYQIQQDNKIVELKQQDVY